MKFPVLAFFERSLRVETRSAIMCWARVGLLGVIFLFMLPMEAMTRTGMFGAPGLRVFQSIVWIDFAFLSVAGLSYFATAISEEKEEMTLGLLRMTNLNPVSILLGKSTSRMIGVGMLLLVQVPVTMLAVTLGGVSLRQVLAAYCTLLAYTFLVCNLALFCSVVFRRSVTATFFAGVLLVGFFSLPSILTYVINDVSLYYQINMTKGGWAILTTLVSWGRDASPTKEIGQIFGTGFGNSPIGFQAISNVVLGIAAFLLSWLVFERFTREQKEDSPVRAPFLRRTGRSSRVPSYVVGSNAITWKDSKFLGGGQFGAFLKFLIVGIIIAGFYITFIASGEVLKAESLGGIMVATSLVSLGAFLAFEVSRLFKSEVQYKTLSSLVTLPITIRELAYRKIVGCVISLCPILIYLVLGLMLIPKQFGDFVNSLLTESYAALALFTAIGQYILFLHIVALLSLMIKRGALPLACFVHYIGGMAVMIPFSIGMMAFGFGRGGMYLPLILGISFTVGATIGIHYWIGFRLTKAAAEE